MSRYARGIPPEFTLGSLQGQWEKVARDQGWAGGDEAAYIRRVEKLAYLLDGRFNVLGFRFGWDSIIGLVPGIGDTVTSGLSFIILHHAWKLGVPAPVLAQMVRNIAIDFAVGFVPIAGDVIDAAWRANRRNVRLLKEHLDNRGKTIDAEPIRTSKA